MSLADDKLLPRDNSATATHARWLVILPLAPPQAAGPSLASRCTHLLGKRVSQRACLDPQSRCLEGVQTALTKLGYDPGAADGKDGPHTRAAVTKFQQAAVIKVDGIAGPETKGALRSTLDQQAAPPPAAAT
ncbi:MAG: peptidoglycan-binding domain-containing protein [Polyangiaceae bacterium]